jgi:hypothetical protein
LHRMAPAVELTLKRIQSAVAAPVALNHRIGAVPINHER